MSFILGIDPGTVKSGFAYWNGSRVLSSGVVDNEKLLKSLKENVVQDQTVAIEMIASYGMAVGKEVFETCVWIGRFMQAVDAPTTMLIERKEVKINLCNSMRANDSNIRAEIINRLGAPGTKNKQGPTYGVTSHAWSALAVALTAQDLLKVVSPK